MNNVIAVCCNSKFVSASTFCHRLLLLFWVGVMFDDHRRASADDALSQKPNILFAFADDLGRYASAYADPNRATANDVIRTPNFDRVAREGTLFGSAHISSPSCTPSRASIVSGRHFFRNGSHSQLHHPWMKGYEDPWDALRGFPLMLQDAGYHIGWTYKLHLTERSLGGKDHNYQSAGAQFNRFSQIVSADADPEQAKARLLNEVRKNFKSFLADRSDDQPFYYWFNPTNTHRDWVRGSGKRLWGINPDDLAGRLPKFLPDNEIIREDFADYLGEAMAFDAAVGVLLEELEQLGELENTMVVISGDHGAPGFPRGKCNVYDFGSQVPLAIRFPGHVAVDRTINAPVSLVDLAATFLTTAGLRADDSMNSRDLTDALHPNTLDPESKLVGEALIGREQHVDDARPGGLPYPMRALRTRDHLLIVNFKPDRWPVAITPLRSPIRGTKDSDRRRMDIDFGPTRDFFVQYEGDDSVAQAWELGFAKRPELELYDVKNDPDQMTNLVHDPEYSNVLSQMHERLIKLLRENGDPRVVAADAFDRPPYARDDPQRGTLAE